MYQVSKLYLSRDENYGVEEKLSEGKKYNRFKNKQKMFVFAVLLGVGLDEKWKLQKTY